MISAKEKILVLSGKGGVGKTTVAVNLALSFALSGKKTGILDVDIHGPNVPKMLGLEGKELLTLGDKMLPVEHESGLKVISLGFIVGKKDSVIWRGPMKHNLIKQFIEDTEWGELDFLVIDFPPGTGDEHISTAQLIGNPSGAVIVSTPQKVAILDSVRAIDFCRKLSVSVCGIVENMSGGIFGKGTIKDVAEENGIPYLGSIDLEKEIVESGDSGRPFSASDSETARSFRTIASKVEAFCKTTENHKEGQK
jgi:ATP-binding protein involved in chromosome partitioning